MVEHLRAGTNIVVLGKHGLVVAADSVVEAERLRAEVSRRLARAVRTAPNIDREALRRAQVGGYASAEDDELHAIATDPISLAAARRGSLYPDHVVFLGPGIVIAEAGENAVDAARRSGRAAPPLVVVPGAGVLQHNAATPGARALIRCLADVTCRLKSDDPIAPLSPEDEAQLLNWDAEKYRQWVDAIDQAAKVVAFAASAMSPARRDGQRITQDASVWDRGLDDAMARLASTVDLTRVVALAVDGTSGTLVGVDDRGTPVAAGSLYNDRADAADIAAVERAAPAHS